MGGFTVPNTLLAPSQEVERIRFFEELNRPRTVLFILEIIIAVNGFLLHRKAFSPGLG